MPYQIQQFKDGQWSILVDAKNEAATEWDAYGYATALRVRNPDTSYRIFDMGQMPYRMVHFIGDLDAGISVKERDR